MNALRAMWGNTHMVVLTALSAALFAAILIPFKIFTIIPGVTEIRPANAVPIVCSILFGPAAAFGSAIGNLVGDFVGGFGPGALFGMIGNFLYGYVPYAMWRAFFGDAVPKADNVRHWAALLFIAAVASAACAFTIGWGIDVIIQGVPFPVLGVIIFFNNFLMAAVLAPWLLFPLARRVHAWRLRYTQILPPAAVARPRTAWLGAILLSAGSLGGLGIGLAVTTGFYGDRFHLPELVKLVVQEEMAMPDRQDAGPGGNGEAATEAAAPARSPASSVADARAGTRRALTLSTLPAFLLLVVGVLLL